MLVAGDALAVKCPKAILIHLVIEQNRQKRLEALGETQTLEVFREEVDRVNKTIINDFTDNFHHCPVYYYIDTNLDKVLAGKFAGILLDTSLKPVMNPVIHDTTDNYLIVFNGIPMWQTERRKMVETKQDWWGGKPNGKALVVNDKRFKQISYIYWLDMDVFNVRRKRKHAKYVYESKKFDLTYEGCAELFDRELNKKCDPATGRRREDKEE